MTLFTDKNSCCGCGSCENICPQKAISMIEDCYGFIYPRIDNSKCIDCGLCQKVCAFQHIQESNTPHNVYAAVSNNKFQLRKSSSGGIFAALATHVINKKGIVYGAVMERSNNKFIVRHKGITSLEELPMLQGSKYVQSDMGDCYKEISSHLKRGRIVLFSGVPCQCAGLKGFLRAEYANLILIDIICHGVPSQKFFNDYINYSFSNLNGICGFDFRDKSKDWELKGRILYEQNHQKTIYPISSSYYSLFLDGQIYRQNCYTCKYASSRRPGDITIGDYWGIQKEHAELISKNKLNIKDGVSCIITNTAKGDQIIAESNNLISIFPSTYRKVSHRNQQLLHPTLEGRFRQLILNTYKTEGYSGVDKLYKRLYRSKRFIYTIFYMIPYPIRNMLKRLKNHIN